MAKIHINNPKQVINGGAKKYYFKVKGLGGPKGDKGDKGDTGSQGPQGPQGNAATISVGSTTTLPVGYDATVENVGSIYNAVLNFGIPQGPQGPQGATGATGAKGDKGDQGNPGPQGEKGTNATVYVGTTSTLNPGSQATVYNSGTDSNAVLNFGIPKGDKGDTGPMPTIAQTTGQAIDQVMSQKATTDALNTKQATITNSSKLSADLVDDTSTTNKFVTAQDKTNWNGKQDALTAGTGIDITGGVISTPAIVPEVVAELPTTGAEGKLYLTPKAHTTSTDTGNPIEATVTAQAGQIESFQLDGDTYQQSYNGSNLIDMPIVSGSLNGVTWVVNDDGSITLNGTATANVSIRANGARIPAVAGETYTLSATGLQNIVNFGYKNADSGADILVVTPGSPVKTVQITGKMLTSANRLDMFISSGKSFNNQRVTLQLEKGSTATAYEPFVGGQPSPNPEYPQQIQTVTGEQTVSINGTNYPINLGSLELCKLGTYQDYIYKDGDSWKVHKATGYEKKIVSLAGIDGYSSVYGTATTSNGAFSIISTNWGSDYATTAGIAIASSVIGVYQSQNIDGNNAANSMVDGTFCQRSGTNDRIYFRFASWARSKTVNEANQMITDNGGIDVWYPLDTPTDTTITDTALIAQLEAIRTASLENGTNTITNTATGTNLAGDMEIGYFGFNPTNRYDKFIWLDLNNNYEQIGGE